MLWTGTIIWGAGALGTIFSFKKELSRLERAGLRIATGIAVILTSCVLLQAVGHATGLAIPHIEPDGSFVRPRGGVFSFGALQLVLLAIAGFAVDTCRFFRRRVARTSAAPSAKSDLGLGLSVPRIHRFGPSALVLGTMLFWFAVFYNGAMSYVWLEDNDPWDHAWAVQWIIESGSFYEPLVNHTDPRTGAPDPIQIFHYLDAYPPGFDIFLAIPALATHGDLVWVLKFYTCLLVALGLLMCYPTLVWFARIGISLAGSGRHDVAAEGRSDDREGQDERRENMARWIGAIGVVILSCVPGYPSRFIWSHPLALLLWAAAIAPLFRLGQTWRWAFPATWLVAATQIVTTTTGAVVGINLVLMFAAVLGCLPAGRASRAPQRPGLWALLVFFTLCAGMWYVTADLNRLIRESSQRSRQDASTQKATGRTQAAGAITGDDSIAKQLERTKRLTLFLFTVLSLSLPAGLFFHSRRCGIGRAMPALRMAAVGLVALVLSTAWWGPMLWRYYEAPKGKARVWRSQKGARGNLHGGFSALIETLAHPADVQLGRYSEVLPWKWVGSQDRNYAWWEFVHPPPRVATRSGGIQNSVTSGIGLGASIIVALFTFCGLGLFTAGKTIRRQIRFAAPSPTSDGASMTPSRATTILDSMEPRDESVAGSAILALALMLAHSLIGLSGNRPSVPVQLFAFRYWHVLAFVAVFCTVVAIGWTLTMMERSRRLAFMLCGATLIPTVALVALASRPYIQASASTDGSSGRAASGAGDAGASVWQLSSRVPLIVTGLSAGLAILSVRLKRRKATRALGVPLSRGMTHPMSLILYVTTVVGYALVQGGGIRLCLNNYRWPTTGVMDGGAGAESRTIEQLIAAKSALGLKSGDRIFPLGGPYRFRFLVAAGFDVSYYDPETYDWLHRNVLDPHPQVRGGDNELRMLDWFYDVRPIEVNHTSLLVANWPVMPLRTTPAVPDIAASELSGPYQYEPDSRRVRFETAVRQVSWKDIDHIQIRDDVIEFQQTDRPQAKNFPEYLHSWLRTRHYSLVWFDQVFFAVCSTRRYLDLESGRPSRVNSFEAVLNDCVQSGYFEIVRGHDQPPMSISLPTPPGLPFPNMPCYLLRVLPQKVDRTYPYWVPCPNMTLPNPR
ncbi:MAG: hypothetical protein HYX75_05655 [Acidobacteria bacterium]|nr:hypothetical protein [Acidobacteriota bacterium]